MKKDVIEICVDEIIPNKNQPRKNFNQMALKELSVSIETYGIIQPIVVRKIDDKLYELISGERRLKATKLSGKKEIPAIIMSVEDDTSAAMALIENLQREDLNFLEEAEAYNRIIKNFNLTQSELATKIGKTQSTIANKMRILKLPENVKHIVVENKLSERHARALLKIDDEEILLQVLDKIIKKNMNVSSTEKLIKSIYEDLKKDKIKNRKNVRNFINYRIYVNTIKNAYNEILKTGINAEFEQSNNDEFIEIKVKIPKNSIK